MRGTVNVAGPNKNLDDYATKTELDAVKTTANSAASDATAAKAAAEEAKTAAASSGMTVFTGVLGTNWTEDENTGVKYQDVAIEGITAEHNGSCDHDDTSIDGTSEGYALYVEEDNQWLTYITNGRHARTFDGYIRFEIFGDPNTVEIPFWVGVS